MTAMIAAREHVPSFREHSDSWTPVALGWCTCRTQKPVPAVAATATVVASRGWMYADNRKTTAIAECCVINRLPDIYSIPSYLLVAITKTNKKASTVVVASEVEYCCKATSTVQLCTRSLDSTAVLVPLV